MQYFISWSYEGVLMKSGVYEFKYYINDADDFSYLKTEVASYHTYNDKPLNPTLVNIINFVVLDEKPPTVTENRYKYSIVYNAIRKYNDGDRDLCIFQKIMTFNTELKTENNLDDVINRIKEEHKGISQINLMSFTLIEVIDGSKEAQE